MKRNLMTLTQSMIIVSTLLLSLTHAQGTASNTNNFLGDFSVKVYCAFSKYVPGESEVCRTEVDSKSSNVATSTSLTEKKIKDIKSTVPQVITKIVNGGNQGGATKIVYLPGPQGPAGKNGTTTIVYQNNFGGAPYGLSAYINAGPSTGNYVYQTTVPGDIWNTFIHQLRWENANGDNANIININATNTFSVNLNSINASTTNLFAQNASLTNATSVNAFSTNASFTNATTGNLFSNNASLTNATNTNLFSVFANFFNLVFGNATGTNLQIENASTTNLTATGTTRLSEAYIASSTQVNSSISSGNATLTTSVVGNATNTNLFAVKASITEATTTYLFSAWANFLNLFVQNLGFQDATGTRLQVRDASTTNLTATGTTRLSEAYIASSTQVNSSISSGNATLTTSVVGNATNTNLFAAKASITEATTTNFFAAILKTINGKIDNFVFNNATGTNIQLENASATNLTATGTTNITNAFIASTTITSGQINSGNATLTTSVVGNATATNVFATNASITNATTTSFFAAILRSLNATIDNLYSVVINTGTLNATSSVNTLVLNASTTNASTTNSVNLLVEGSSTLASTTVTNITGNILAFATGFISSLNTLVGNIVTINSTTGNIDTVNSKNINATGTSYLTTVYASTTNASTTNSDSVNAQNLSVSGSSTLASTTIGNFVAQDGNLNSLNAASTTVSGTLAAGNLFTTGSSTLGSTTVTNVTGNILAFVNGFIDTLATNILNVVTGNIETLNSGTVNATNINATGTSYLTNLYASTTNASTTNTNLVNSVNLNVSGSSTLGSTTVSSLTATGNFSAMGPVNLGTTTFFGSLIPSASTTWHTLGTLSNPWSELFVSSSSVYIGGTKISNVNGILNWSGTGINFSGASATSTSNFGTIKASSTQVTDLTSVNATSTNLFTQTFKALNSIIDNLVATNATITNATSTNLFAGLFKATNATIDNLTLTNSIAKATITNATSTNLFASLFNFGTASGNTLNVGNITSTNTASFNNLNATNATISTISIGNFSKSTIDKIANIATNSTTNSLTYSTSTNILESIVNGKVSTTTISIPASSAGNISNYSIIKGSSQTVIGTTLTDDLRLKFPIAAGEKWYVQVNYEIYSPGNSTSKVAMGNTSTGGTCNYTMTNPINVRAMTICGVGITTGTPISTATVGGQTLDTGILSGIVTGGSTNGEVKFQFAVNTGTSSIINSVDAQLIAIKLSGADLAEVYFSKDLSIQEGDVVALDGSGVSQVSKSSKNYQKSALGVVSTKPGMVMGEVDGEGKPVIVGLSGRVPVKVTDKNGKIKAGDFLTASDEPGLAMKATSAGQVIGQALTDDVGNGKVIVFIKNTYHDGTTDSDTEESITSKLVESLKQTLEKLSKIYLDMELWVNSINSNTIHTQQLCVGNECFSESDMRDFRQYLNDKRQVKQESVVPQAQTQPAPETPQVPQSNTENATDTTVQGGETNTSTEPQASPSVPSTSESDSSTTQTN